jgi:imidazolonepropionase-like amidohydrolase
LVIDGANVVEVYASGSFIRGGKIRSQLSEEELKTVVAEAHKIVIRVAAHAFGEETIAAAVDCGVGYIEHGIVLTESLCDLMLKKGIYYVPTLSAFAELCMETSQIRRELFERHLKTYMKLALRTGNPQIAGTDFAGVDTERHGQNYFELMQLAKCTPGCTEISHV